MDRPSMTGPGELYACVYADQFPAQAMLRLRPALRNTPCAILEGEPPAQYVCSVNAQARAAGLHAGMKKADLDAFSGIALLTRAREEEAVARRALLECAGAFSPRVEDTCAEDRGDLRHFCCVLDISGAEKLFGPPEEIAKKLQASVRQVGVAAAVAVSGNFHTAVCIARSASGNAELRIIPAREESAALAPLPLSVLEIPEERAEVFSWWGIKTLGMLAALPERELIARMGQEGARLRRLARGELPHLFRPAEPELALDEHMELDTPVEAIDSLLFVIGAMVQQLISRAAARALALASLTLIFQLENKTRHVRAVRPALPANDRPLWIKLIYLDLEAHPPQASVLSLTIKGEPGGLRKTQLGLFSPQLPEPRRLEMTLARLRAIVGENNVGRPVLKDTHRPDAFSLQPFTVFSGDAANSVWSGPRTALRRLRPAEPARILRKEGRPRKLIFRDKDYEIERAYGPWLASGNWWNPAVWSIEEWDLAARAADGMRLCCCAVRNRTENSWTVVALYD